jgi:hypothetical protein
VVSEVIAYTVSRLARRELPLRLRVRVIWTAWAACGNKNPGGDGDHLVGARDRAAVAVVGLAVPDRDVLPRLARQLPAQILLISLDRENVVCAPAVEVLGVLTLGVEGIGGDDNLGEIVDFVEKW